MNVKEELRKACGKGRKVKRSMDIFQFKTIFPFKTATIRIIQNSHNFLAEIRKTMQGLVGDLLNYK